MGYGTAARALEIDKRVVGALKPCETRETVEETFGLFHITDMAAKIDYLEDCMGNPLIFFSDGDPDVESRYLTILSMFLTGEWKLYE
ncbi:MAG: hypothetical protein LBG84_01525 [Treponema sp.]|nr:hypothetical protein [Treponema sp.]